MSTTFKLHGLALSTCTRRVALVAKERNIPYTLSPVDLGKGEHKSASYIEHHPFGQVPYITQDDGFELYESRAICRYLANLGSGPALVPTEPRALAKFEQAASVEYSNFDPIASTIAYEKVFKLYQGKKTNEDLVTELVARLEAKLDGYEKILSKQKYLAGDEVTLADLFHLPYGTMVFEQLQLGGIDKRPNVLRWWKDITSRPSWQAVKGGA
ncbi:glutathione S-transferase-like protein [Lactarius psammicola]|nr:glutathione S-transferase-like protein [Lactarius psammicola]